MEKVNDNNYLEKFLQILKEDMINCMHNLAKFKKKKKGTVNPCNVLVMLYVVNSQLIEPLLLALSFFYQFIFFFFMGNACVQ